MDGIANPIQLSAQIFARQLDLPLQLVLAVVQVESGGNVYAWNPEPQYRYLWDVKRQAPYAALPGSLVLPVGVPNDFPALIGDRDAEWWGQRASWGPMQLMGAVARQLGFADHFPALCDSHVGINYGCRHLATLRDRFLSRNGWPGVVAAYNAGSPRAAGGGGFVNQAYVNKVDLAGGLKGLT